MFFKIIYLFLQTKIYLLLVGCGLKHIMISSKKKFENGKKWRASQKNQDHRERNWTDLEVELFCSILSDGEYKYALTLESKALKKQANKEVYEGLQMHFKVALADPDFIKENEIYNDVLGKPLDIEIPKLRNKYNNLKKGWRAAVDRAKS